MYKKLAWLAQDGETAHLVAGAPDKRPYEVVAQNPDNGEWIGIDAGVADPSWHGCLLTDEPYFWARPGPSSSSSGSQQEVCIWSAHQELYSPSTRQLQGGWG